MKNGISAYVKLGAVCVVLCIGLFGFAGVSVHNTGVKASAFGPSASHTNAPGEDNCTACHASFPLNSGTGSMTISGLPPNYKPGQQIPITVTVSDPNAIVFGSQTTAIDASGLGVGTFTPPLGNPQTMQVLVGLVGGHLRSYLEHTVDGIIPTQPNIKSWTFTWTAPPQRVGKISFFTAANAASGDGSPSDDFIYSRSAATLSGSALSNFDNDTKSDLAVWRPSSGSWYILNSTDQGFQSANWGVSSDVLVPGDYDADGKTDFAVWRPSGGLWLIYQSTGGVALAQFGANGDIPVPGDYDGDLKTDFAVWRPSTGTWFVYRSSDFAVSIAQWGVASDVTAQGDYDADGKTDFAVFRPATGQWCVFKSSDNTPLIAAWGGAGDRPVQGDYDSDGKTDFAVYRPSTGTWYVYRSSDGGVNIAQWGNSSDVPIPADYDGDGKSDIAIFRSGAWFIIRSSDSGVNIINWGTAGDQPVPAGYIAH
jgi:hypothetical protein